MGNIRFQLDDDETHILWWHKCNHGEHHDLYPARLPNSQAGWTVVQKDPLTVTPSIMCGSCKTHGFITNGKWVAV